MSGPAPGSNGSDYNLLFGTLAVQMDFITKDALLAGMGAWVMDKSKSLGQILVDQGVFTPSRHALLEALVQETSRPTCRRTSPYSGASGVA